MALLRNRLVQLLGPTGPDVSPIWEVRYPDGTKEQTPLKNIQLSDTELKDFEKDNGKQLSLHVRPISDKEHQDIVDSQNTVKIQERIKKGEVNRADNLVQVPSYVKASDLATAKPVAPLTPDTTTTTTPNTQYTPKSTTPLQSKSLPNQVR